MKDNVEQVIRNGRRHPYVGKAFREGLTAIRDDILAKDPNALPGATTNHCYFCWYVLAKAIVPVTSPKTGAISLPILDQAWTPPE